MTIKSKIISLVVAFGLVASAITGLGLKTVQDYEVLMQDYNRASENAFRGERLNRLLLASVIDVRGLFIQGRSPRAQAQLRSVEPSLNTFETALRTWRHDTKVGEMPELTQVEAAARPLLDGWRQTAAAMLSASVDGRRAELPVNQDDLYRRRLALQKSIDDMIVRISADLSAKRAAVKLYQENRVREFVAIAGLGTLLVFGLSLWIAITGIANPLDRIRQSIMRISEGDYDTPLPEEAPKSEIGEIWVALAILKARAEEGARLTHEKLEREQSLRELVLD